MVRRIVLVLVLAVLPLGCGKKDPSRQGAESYLKLAKTSEARSNLQAIARACREAYRKETIDRSGKVRPQAFPSAGPTPEKIPCRREAVPARVWEAAGWNALHFAPTDPVYFQYQVIAEGEGASATFTARAHADLDCDGQASTFEVTGRVEGGEVVIGPLVTRNERE
jgi:hypothetical protein